MTLKGMEQGSIAHAPDQDRPARIPRNKNLAIWRKKNTTDGILVPFQSHGLLAITNGKELDQGAVVIKCRKYD